MSKDRFQPKLKIKKGDTVLVIAGSHKGSEGVVTEIFPDKSRVVVSDVNIVKRHIKPTANNQGGIKEKPAPIHISNVMLIDPSTKEPTRIGRRVEDGKIVRFSKKTGQTIE